MLRALARSRGSRDPCALAAAVQDAVGYVPPVALEPLADRCGTTPEQVQARIAADPQLHLEPPGRHRVTICTGRTCARRGGARLVRVAREMLATDLFRTSADGAIHLEPFRCFGQCAMAPNIRIDGGLRGAMTETRLRLLLQMLQQR